MLSKVSVINLSLQGKTVTDFIAKAKFYILREK